MFDKKSIQWIGSPNFTPDRTQEISKIIVHWIVGDLAVADRVFSNKKSRVSAHYAIEDDIIHQYVDERNTTWHTNTANPYSIGIEHSAQPGRDASEITLETSSKLIAEICQRYKLDPMAAIQPHNKYVETKCPGTIDIDFLKLKASEIINMSHMPNV